MRSVQVRRSPTLLALLAISCITGTASAQRLYRLEASAAGMYQSYDKSTDLAGAAGGQARLGYWLPWHLGLEVEGTYAQPKTESAGFAVKVKSIAASLLYNIPIGTYSSTFLRGGYASVTYGGSCPAISVPGTGPCGSTGAVVGGLGLRLALSPTVMVRTEGLVIRSSAFSFSNYSGSLGLSFMIGSKPLNDTDGDGVFDRYDRCPDTRVGALVDKQGCATDHDGDGVPDGLDRCPSTAPGAAVDSVGCPADGDSDGVLDGIDQCPDTPAGATVNAQGCPSDADQDGVVDGLDRCPDTPPGATVDGLGCPGDQDNDQVLDGIDQCPDTPSGTAVNAFGCSPTLDSDGDGIPDAADLCPATAAGARIDATGCAIEPADTGVVAVETPRMARAFGPWTVPGAAFEFRGTELGDLGKPVLDSVATVLLANPGVKVEIAGYAHDRLGPEENLRLSTERAQSVRLYLLQRGVRGTQLTIKGYGAQRLIAEGDSDEARRINRRVEIHVVNPEP